MHLYLGGNFVHRVNNFDIPIAIETRYPWEGSVKITLSPESPVNFCYALRIPSWCSNYTLKVNGRDISVQTQKGYAYLSREWKNGDVIEIDFAMAVRINTANPAVREDIGKVAVSRGPVIYCLEEADNGKNLHLLYLSDDAEFRAEFKGGLLGGVETLISEGWALKNDWPGGTLYREVSVPAYEKKNLTWIPYYAWANRGPGEMRVWLNRR
jgi:DUF1680 family protein